MLKHRHIIVVTFFLLSGVPVFATPTQVSVGFSPSGQALQNVLDAIHSARGSIDLAAYSFTSREVADALIAAADKGITVRVVADKKGNSGKYSAVTSLTRHGVPVRLNDHYAIMHNKFLIVDEKTTETGSFNYTASADRRNAENALVIWNEPQLAGLYEKEFTRLWEESSRPATKEAPQNTSALTHRIRRFFR